MFSAQAAQKQELSLPQLRTTPRGHPGQASGPPPNQQRRRVPPRQPTLCRTRPDPHHQTRLRAQSKIAFTAALLLLTATAFAQPKGRPATQTEIDARNLTVYPDGRGLPIGKGRASEGAPIYKSKCAECHNDRGEGREGQYPPLVGGIGSLTSTKPLKTVGSYWPHATTVFDYIRRSMPFDHPRSLSANEVYSVTAFVLHLNGLVALEDELNEKTLPKVAMPNRDGFVPDKRPDIKSKRSK